MAIFIKMFKNICFFAKLIPSVLLGMILGMALEFMIAWTFGYVIGNIIFWIFRIENIDYSMVIILPMFIVICTGIKLGLLKQSYLRIKEELVQVVQQSGMGAKEVEKDNYLTGIMLGKRRIFFIVYPISEKSCSNYAIIIITIIETIVILFQTSCMEYVWNNVLMQLLNTVFYIELGGVSFLQAILVMLIVQIPGTIIGCFIKRRREEKNKNLTAKETLLSEVAVIFVYSLSMP